MAGAVLVAFLFCFDVVRQCLFFTRTTVLVTFWYSRSYSLVNSSAGTGNSTESANCNLPVPAAPVQVPLKNFVVKKSTGKAPIENTYDELNALNPLLRSRNIATSNKKPRLTLDGNTTGLPMGRISNNITAGNKTTGLLDDEDFTEKVIGNVPNSNSTESFSTHHALFSFKDDKLRWYCIVMIGVLTGLDYDGNFDSRVRTTVSEDGTTLYFQSSMQDSFFNKNLLIEAVKTKVNTVQTVMNMVSAYDTEFSNIRETLNLGEGEAISGTAEIKLPFVCDTKIKGIFPANCTTTLGTQIYVLLKKFAPQKKEKQKAKGLSIAQIDTTKCAYEDLCKFGTSVGTLEKHYGITKYKSSINTVGISRGAPVNFEEESDSDDDV
jgi:hypothetical protein